MNLTSCSPPLALGMQGAAVVRLEQALRALGLAIPPMERANGGGMLGPETIAALEALQRDLGVPATGIVDVATIKVINAMVR